MKHVQKSFSIAQSSWFMALILLGIFSTVSSYKYGWDDQHLEITLLKHLIDPTLYQGDYYVESLKKNFSTFFYPILSKIITVDQIPAAYCLLYYLSRYFLFFWSYKIWLLLSGNRTKAFFCVMVFILMVRVDEFLYRTFSHQEFALAVILGGLYFFFKGRFVLAAVLYGAAANLNAIYSLFPMIYTGAYLLCMVRQHGWKTLLKTFLTFGFFSLPFLIWILKNRFWNNAPFMVDQDKDWLELFIKACPQNFFFPEYPLVAFKQMTQSVEVFLLFAQPYLFLIVLFILNFCFHRLFRENKKAVVLSAAAFFLLGLCFIFTYLYPNRTVIDLNLTRNIQFLLFILVGYTMLYIFGKVEKEKPLFVFLTAVLFTLIKYSSLAAFSVLALIGLDIIRRGSLFENGRFRYFSVAFGSFVTAGAVFCLVYFLNTVVYQFLIRLNLLIIHVLLALCYFIFLVNKDRLREQGIRLALQVLYVFS